MDRNSEETISLLQLRQDLSSIVHNVIFKGKEYIVVKNQNPKLVFKITPLSENDFRVHKDPEKIWKNFINRKKMKNISLEKIRLREKKLRKY